MKELITALFVFTLFGCATRPADISPSMVSSSLYSEMSCRNLELELQSRYSELETLSEQQIDDRSWDIALNIILIPGLGALTDDQEEEIAASKGHIIAIRDQLSERCLRNQESGQGGAQ